MAERLQLLVNLIAVRTGLLPRTFSKALRPRDTPAESARRSARRGNFIVLTIPSLFTLGVAVLAPIMSVTLYPLFNAAAAGSLGLCAVVLFFTGVRWLTGDIARRLEARQAVDHQSRPRVRQKKRCRDRLIQLAQAHPDWALGFADEVWWSRLEPHLHAWAEADHPLRLVEQAVAKDDPDPKALACYGVLLRRARQDEAVWLRFVDGHPVSALTTQFLEWCCSKLEALGVPVWVLIGTTPPGT